MSVSKGFRLILRFHTPVIMPTASPRLDLLLHEAMCRLHQDWESRHELPLERDVETGVYCASQLLVGVTPRRPLVSTTEKLVSAVTRQDLHLASNTKKKFSSQLPDANKLTQHHGISIPFGVFYGVGDAARCADLLPFLSGLGRESARHYGSFDIERIEPSTDDSWRLRPWPVEHSPGWSSCPHEFIEDKLMLEAGDEEVIVMRPPRLIREVLFYAR